MTKYLEYSLRYIIIVFAFVFSILNKSMTLVNFSILLLYIIFFHLTNYQKFNENTKIFLILLEILFGLYLAQRDITMITIYMVNPILDVLKELKARIAGFYIILIIGIGIYYLRQNLNIYNIFTLFTIFIFSITLGYVLRQNKKIKTMENKIDELIIDKKELINEHRNKDILLEEIYTNKERNRISRDIHDSVGHRLSAIIIQLSAIEKLAKINGDKASELSGNLRNYATEALNDIRKVLRRIKPQNTGKDELITLIQEIINQNSKLTGLNIKFKFSSERYPIPNDLEEVFVNAVREFISNSIKHGKASLVDINLFYKEDEIILSMRDNGLGSEKIKKGIGLTALEERVKEHKGSLTIETGKKKGFLINIVFYRGKYDKGNVS
ncbi:sensor histidine kinase [Miniphocaeibacter halophilus]|uniref:Sensor histidine kinase n=1 Tax=Miniphocaeibacter halophilus TaxID=2931922 RepID=A0AC61MVI6_9FIRM|nr:sensor histidine kinase [Miniphocaeibacter halophilus]QQK07871.1 sensor histidine kinase [Miniphocaeibacter halophilus]